VAVNTVVKRKVPLKAESLSTTERVLSSEGRLLIGVS
jgi:hypothetical protein